jgi:hypothetical protein
MMKNNDTMILCMTGNEKDSLKSKSKGCLRYSDKAIKLNIYKKVPHKCYAELCR